MRNCVETKSSTNKPTLLPESEYIYGRALLLFIHNMEDLLCQGRWYFTGEQLDGDFRAQRWLFCLLCEIAFCDLPKPDTFQALLVLCKL